MKEVHTVGLWIQDDSARTLMTRSNPAEELTVHAQGPGAYTEDPFDVIFELPIVQLNPLYITDAAIRNRAKKVFGIRPNLHGEVVEAQIREVDEVDQVSRFYSLRRAEIPKTFWPWTPDDDEWRYVDLRQENMHQRLTLGRYANRLLWLVQNEGMSLR